MECRMQNAECRTKKNPAAFFSILHSAFCVLHSSSRSRDHKVRQVPFQLRRRIRNDDSVLVAHGLAEATGHALVPLDKGDLVVIGHRLVVRLDHGDAFERTDVDAELTSRAELLDHLGLRNVFRLDPGDELAVLVLDGVDRAVNAAHRAVDAALRMDVVLAACRTPDRVRGALHFADRTADAFVGDEVWHWGFRVYLTRATIARSLAYRSWMLRARRISDSSGAARSPIQRNAPSGSLLPGGATARQPGWCACSVGNAATRPPS